MGSNLRSYARLKFFTKDQTIILDSSVNNDILSVTTQKSLAGAAHTFSISLSPRIAKSQNSALNTYLIADIIKPYDLVEISFKTGNEGYKVEMIGFVSRASIDVQLGSEGQPSRQFSISGFGMSKLLQSVKIFFNPYINVSGDPDRKFNGIGGKVYFMSEEARKIFESTNVAEFIKELTAQVFTNSFRLGNNSPYFGMTFGSRGLHNKEDSSVNPIDNTQGLKVPDLIDFQGGLSTLFSENRMNNPDILTNLTAGPEFSLWELMQSYSDPPFHECFVDLRREGIYNYPDTQYALGPSNIRTQTRAERAVTQKEAENSHLIDENTSGLPPMVLYLRTAPFSPDTWDKLTMHMFNTSDVIYQETATSEENIYNYYNVMCLHDSLLLGEPQLAALAAAMSDPELGRARVPIYDTPSILKYGLKQYPIQTTKYVSFIKPGIDGAYSTALPVSLEITNPCATLARQLLRWFSFGEEFETGTISLKGRVGIGADGASIGSRLIECAPSGVPTGKEFYIEGVTQTWQFGSTLLTTLLVTRGHFPEDYIDQTTGENKKGRFNKVISLCKELRVDQKTQDNAKLFTAIEPIDKEKG